MSSLMARSRYSATFPDIRRDHIAVCQKRLPKFLLIDRIRVIEMLKKDVLFDLYISDLLRENGFLLKQFIDLETDLRVLSE